ncbi:MAG: MOSC domain-containing protein [Candidatus Heimdallarchaeaceae archaeon]
MKGIVKSINISAKKGVIKNPIDECEITPLGLKNDAHSGSWHRQVSLLAEESINKMKKLGLNISYGSFAENITTEGLVLYELPIGTKLKINNVILEVTQIGKKCHEDCAIKQQTGKCVMPKEGIFTKVLNIGKITKGDIVEVLN